MSYLEFDESAHDDTEDDTAGCSISYETQSSRILTSSR